MNIVEGNIIDLKNREIYPGEIHIANGRIAQIRKNSKSYESYICPGFIDAHVHIESSMLTPENFSRLIIKHGTIAIVNDPHEIANVMGIPGIDYMMENSKRSSVKCFFGIPSCVPATPFDASGCTIDSSDVEQMAKSGKFIALSEMMNVPGVLYNDVEVIRKINTAKRYNLPIDGHAPNLQGEDLFKYANSGITTDHETISVEEGLQKIATGMKIIIREGSAAKNYDILKPLIKTNPESILFCTDDAHPDEIIKLGHIDRIVKMALKDGFDLFDVLKIASKNAIDHYHLPVGCLQEGDYADFIRIDDLSSFRIQEVYIHGEKKFDVMDKNAAIVENATHQIVYPNNFYHSKISLSDITCEVKDKILAIGTKTDQLWTSKMEFDIIPAPNFESDIERDILKIVYVNRYLNLPPQIAYIHGVGITNGAFGSSISHDSHNILAVGTTDSDIVDVINEIIDNKGALVVKSKEKLHSLPLPIAGIMSDQRAESVARKYEELNEILQKSGSKLQSPFMTLAFMSLLVIPEIKIGEKGLFDYTKFDFIE
ncbi:adenine deaminase [Porphyromonadaceae bacterium OttesenSCG-928-L07]|nr:adenine deaminase [Porphyromonadaceae bacterium OttesenSCG-928-L07]